MPTLFRLLTVTGTITALVAGTLYVMATQFEPQQQPESKAVPGLKIRKE